MSNTFVPAKNYTGYSIMLQVATTLKDPDLRRRMVYLATKQDQFLAELAGERRINKSAIIRQLVDELMADTLLS